MLRVLCARIVEGTVGEKRENCGFHDMAFMVLGLGGLRPLDGLLGDPLIFRQVGADHKKVKDRLPFS